MSGHQEGSPPCAPSENQRPLRKSWQDEPTRRGIFPVVLVGLAMVAFIAVKTGRDALYFGESQRLEDLPLAFMGTGLASVPAALLHLKLMDWIGVRGARVAVLGGVGLSFLALAPLVDPEVGWVMNVLFVAVPVSFGAVFASAWLLAGDLLEGAHQADKAVVYTRVGAASTLGGVVGGGLARSLAEVLSSVGLLAVGGGLLLGGAVLAGWSHRRYPSTPRGQIRGKASRSSKPSGLLRRPIVLALIAVSGTAAVTSLLIELQFYAVASTTGAASATFFANFYRAPGEGAWI